MEGEAHSKNCNVPREEDDQFPKGLRVLVVDDNVTHLHLLEKMLQDCSYQVTKCQQGEEALAMIRENEGGFDIVLADVHMPGMDGLQLLTEIVNMGITLPVVLFSSDAKKETILKGVKSGGCDFLVKPIQINTLKILWQHVLRSNRSSSNNVAKELETPQDPTTCSSNNTHTRTENEEENSKSSKRSSEDEADQGQTKSRAKKPRVIWTPELNQMFIMAVNRLGNDDAKPKKILQIMRKMTGVPHLTRQNVSSHLQKHRVNSKKIAEVSEHQSAHSSLINGTGSGNLTHSTAPSSSLTGCGGIGAASVQYPSQAMSVAPGQQRTCCSMRMPNLVEFPNDNTLPRYQIGLQSQPPAPLQHPLLQNYGHQQVNESAQCLSYAPVPSVGFTSPMNNNTHPGLPNQSDGSLLMQMFQTHLNMQIPDEAAAARHLLPANTHPHPLHSQISTHDIQSLNSSTHLTAPEQGLPGALSSIGASANESCGSNIVAVKGELSHWNNHNTIAENYQAYGNEAMFADMLDKKFFEDLGLGEDFPLLDSSIQDNRAT